MKTLQQWRTKKVDFGEFIEDGDEVDQELFDYFLGVLPPRSMKPGGFLVGEPVSSNDRGEAVYSAFVGSYDIGRYYFKQLMTYREFLELMGYEAN